jgi:O-6-methylguanine DNA methyltransferase
MKNVANNRITKVISPLGIFELKIKDEGLYSVDLIDHEDKGKADILKGERDKFSTWLINYFQGELQKPLPIESFILTNSYVFNKILEELLKVEYGKTITYSELALKTNTHPRVVGMTMARNPVPIFIPCHRVVGKNSLGGYSYGIKIKEWLLNFEINNLKKIKDK